MARRKTKEEFEIDAKFVHENRYTYDCVEYKNSGTKVKIICKIHGYFWQTPHDHLKGQGCPKCGLEKRADKRKLSLSEFIIKSKAIHHGKYGYDLVELKNYKERVSIICPIHGVFEQTPREHLQGCGCPKCANEKISRLNIDSNDDFIKKATTIHGNEYDYSYVNYVGNKSYVDIICKKHGVFSQRADHHLSGCKCPKCSNGSSSYEKEIIEMLEKSYNEYRENFIEKCNLVHNCRYDYTNVELSKMKDKVRITCPAHGEFTQRADAHLNGQGCPLCKNEKISKKKTGSICDFINKANTAHNGKYSYDKSVYINSSTPICIICPTHGEFWQIPSNHISKAHPRGCPKCNGGIKLSNNEFIQKANAVHDFRYDYSKTNYRDSHTKVLIGCGEHGYFWQTPNAHLNGQGCPSCKIGAIKEKNTSTIEEFIYKANHIHKNKYDYSKADYINSQTNIKVICLSHGVFYQTPSNHLKGEGCPKCANNMSHFEDEIVEVLNQLQCEQRNRKILNGKEIDLYFSKYNIGIEFNGLYWHSEESGKDKTYHLNKLNICNSRGIELIQIFEDEWVNKRAICENILKRVFNLTIPKEINKNGYQINEIENKQEIYDFLNENDIDGKADFDLGIVAKSNGAILGVMTFIKNCDGEYELNRIATNIKLNYAGIEKELFLYFISHYNAKKIIYFADRRWTINANNNLYTELGFKIDSIIEPSYAYYNPRASKLKRLREEDIGSTSDYTRIWDCGKIRYVYIN